MPTPTPTATVVSIEAPANIPAGGDFVARVSITQVTDFDAYQFNFTYNPAVIQIIGAESGPEGVTRGLIDSTTVPVAMWAFIPSATQGAIVVLGNIPGFAGLTGSGYLAEIHFHVIGSPGENSDITPTKVGLFNNMGNQIAPVTLVGDSVQVVAPSK